MSNSDYKLYSEVQLAHNLPDLGCIKGDVATIIDAIITPENRKAYCLEFFDTQGNTLPVAIVSEDDIQLPLEHGVVNYRTSIADGGVIEKRPPGNRSPLFIQRLKIYSDCSKEFLPPEPKLKSDTAADCSNVQLHYWQYSCWAFVLLSYSIK
ncbi:MAG: DUF4926 domain-containing protein [Segetibacter sp.]